MEIASPEAALVTIRIIAGARRGAHLHSLPGASTRPLLGRVRRSLFDLLGGCVVEARMLDLFAGSGAVGLEALSRGARWLTAVESNPAALEVIRKNIAKLRFEDRVRAVRGTLPGALASTPLPPDTHPYELVFIMPPFGEKLLAPTLAELVRHGELLAPGAVIVGQFETGEPVPDPPPPGLRVEDERIYGVTHLVFWSVSSSLGEGAPTAPI